jgi:hypothetical protein
MNINETQIISTKIADHHNCRNFMEVIAIGGNTPKNRPTNFRRIGLRGKGGEK